MPTKIDLDALAQEVKTAQDSRLQIEPFSTRVPGFDISAAYQVAELVHSARTADGAKPVGRKIGFTNPDMWSRFGVRDPIWAYIYDTTVVVLEDTHVECSLASFTEPKIEPEIVFHFRSAPQPDSKLDDILDAVDWVAHGFEIVQSHFPGWRFEAADTVADWALHGTLLIGPRQPVSTLGGNPVDTLAEFSLELRRDDAHVETGGGANVLGNPLAAVSHLLSVLREQPRSAPLRSGEVVTTGTITTAQSVHVGDRWRSKLGGIALPDLSVEFVA